MRRLAMLSRRLRLLYEFLGMLSLKIGEVPQNKTCVINQHQRDKDARQFRWSPLVRLWDLSCNEKKQEEQTAQATIAK